ncbi:MAG: GDP-mannose 4,6-dehydratase [Pseudomonadota bacterium]
MAHAPTRRSRRLRWATSVTATVRSFVEWAFEDVGIKLDWRGEGVEEKGFDAETRKCLVEVDSVRRKWICCFATYQWFLENVDV